MQTKEKQYNECIEVMEQYGRQSFGIMSNQTWVDDPKRLVFMLSRYKFVSKMFAGTDTVLEIGCADAFGSRIVSQEVKSLTVSDFDPIFIGDANKRNCPPHTYTAILHDILDGPLDRKFDAIYSLDVLEHINQEDEATFMKNAINSLSDKGSMIIGMPSIQSQEYASAQSKKGHVNCKNAQELKILMQKYFENVFIFSMNDEVVHTGFYPMANYLLALCCYPKQKS